VREIEQALTGDQRIRYAGEAVNADSETGVSRKVTPYPVVATMVTGFQWSKDGKRVVFSRRVNDRFQLFVMNRDGSGQSRQTAGF